MKNLSNMFFDAGGPFLLIIIFGLPILLFIVVGVVIFFTVKFIIKAVKEKKKQD